MSSIKVRYDGRDCAYLDEPALPDGSYLGTNKYTDLPVHLRWDGEKWAAVCHPEFSVDDWVFYGVLDPLGETGCYCGLDKPKN